MTKKAVTFLAHLWSLAPATTYSVRFTGSITRSTWQHSISFSISKQAIRNLMYISKQCKLVSNRVTMRTYKKKVIKNKSLV